MFDPRSSISTLSPASVSSLAAQPPVIPEPTTIASNLRFLAAPPRERYHVAHPFCPGRSGRQPW